MVSQEIVKFTPNVLSRKIGFVLVIIISLSTDYEILGNEKQGQKKEFYMHSNRLFL